MVCLSEASREECEGKGQILCREMRNRVQWLHILAALNGKMERTGRRETDGERQCLCGEMRKGDGFVSIKSVPKRNADDRKRTDRQGKTEKRKRYVVFVSGTGTVSDTKDRIYDSRNEMNEIKVEALQKATDTESVSDRKRDLRSQC